MKTKMSEELLDAFSNFLHILCHDNKEGFCGRCFNIHFTIDATSSSFKSDEEDEEKVEVLNVITGPLIMDEVNPNFNNLN